MKKLVSIILILVLALSLMTFLTACRQTGDCDFCSKRDVKVKSGKFADFDEVLLICKECEDEIKELQKEFNR